MKTIKQKKRTNLTRFFMKAILVVISTALIVYFMPRGDEFGYKYELNRPWNYGLLIANTKFPILKNDSLIHQEKETTMRDFQPYYNYNKVYFLFLTYFYLGFLDIYKGVNGQKTSN